MTFIVTVVLTFLLICAALLVFHYAGVPVYRVDATNVQVLLQSVLNETATEDDWDVFIAVPIHSDPELDKIRLHCAALAAHDMAVRQQRIQFSASGRKQIEAMLNEIKTKLFTQTEQNHD